MSEPPDLSGFVGSLSSAWRAGDVRPTFSVEAKPRYLRSLQAAVLANVTKSLAQTPPPISTKPISERPQLIYAEPGKPVYHAFTMIWPLVCRRLEGFPEYHFRAIVRRVGYPVPPTRSHSAVDLQDAGP